MVRTINDDSCQDCRAITNWYDSNMGRLCPQCTAKRCAQFGKNLASQHDWSMMMRPFDYPEDMIYLASGNKDLLTMPLIDHSNDIEVESTVYHTVVPELKAFREKTSIFKKRYVTKKEQEAFWKEVEGLTTKIGLDIANHFAGWYRNKDMELKKASREIGLEQRKASNVF